MEKLVYKHVAMINTLRSLESIIKKFNNPPVYADEEDIEAYMTSLIKRFEYSQEALWKFFKEYLKVEKGVETLGSKDVFRRCYEYKFINEQEAELLLNTIEDRNATAHDYDGEIAQMLTAKIVEVYYPLFREVKERMQVEGIDIIADRFLKKYEPMFKKTSK